MFPLNESSLTPSTLEPHNTLSFDVSTLVGSQLLRKHGKSVDSNTVVVDVIGFYFSAHWCPPCRAFTPQLGNIYQQCRLMSKSFEVIFVSSDQSIHQFNSYFDSMADWLALPFGSHYKQALSTRFGIQGIPTLVLINGLTGAMITTEGRQRVMEPSFISLLPSDLDVDIRSVTSIDGLLNKLESSVEQLTNEQKRTGFTLICSALNNLLNSPGESKFRTMKKSNKSIETKLNHPVLREILKFSGFRETSASFVCYRFEPRKLNEIVETLSTISASLHDDDPPHEPPNE